LKTIEEIYTSKTVGDLWDEFNKPSKSDPILSFSEGVTYKIRLIGPFVNCERLFLPSTFDLEKILNPIELKMILIGDSNVCEAVINRVLNSAPDNIRTCLHIKSINDIKSNSAAGKNIIEIVNLLTKMQNKRRWQKVILCNVIMLPDVGFISSYGNPSIVCLTSQLLEQVVNHYKTNYKISGLYAHNMLISKQGTGFGTKYIVNLSEKEEMLPKNLTSLILNNGLLDIPKYVKSSNDKTVSKNNMKGFIYRMVSDYKMSDELMKEVFLQANKIEDMNEIEEIDKNLSDLPFDSFEHRVSDNPICSLEL
jgi:hypothetical protein